MDRKRRLEELKEFVSSSLKEGEITWDRMEKAAKFWIISLSESEKEEFINELIAKRVVEELEFGTLAQSVEQTLYTG
jgi:hypothetical protein